MRTTVLRQLTACSLLLTGPLGCGGGPESETRRAYDRIDHLMPGMMVGAWEYDEADPARPVVGLALDGAPILDAGMRDVGKLTTLRTLSLSWTSISDVGLRHLTGLANLRTLNLQRTMVTDAGLLPLGSLPNLHTLDLSGNPLITDQGLRHLRRLRNLRVLVLSDTKVTDTGAAELAHALPEVEIRR